MTYKDTPLGKMPDTWGIAKIKDIAKVVTDYVANGSFASLAENVTYRSEEDIAVLIRLVDYNNDFKGDFVFIDEHAYEFLSKSKLFGGEIIISNVGANVGTVFRCPVLKYKMSLAPNAIMVQFNGNDSFYYHWFKGHYGQKMLKSIVTGSAQPKFNKTNFKDMLVPVPPIEVQNKIASLLDAIELKIAQNTAINENLEQQSQALFKAWFVDFEPFGGIMPDDWSECILDSMCSLIIKGITPKYIEHSAQFVINQKCVRNHQIDLSLARCHEPKKVNEKWLQYGDIVVNSTGTGTLGRAAQVLFTPNNMTVDSHVTIIRASKQEYIYYLGLWATSHEHDFEMLQTGSTGQTDLPRERLKQMPVILPSDDILCKFSEIIKPIADIRIKNQQENQSLAALRDTLLPKLMNGEIDVSAVKI